MNNDSLSFLSRDDEALAEIHEILRAKCPTRRTLASDMRGILRNSRHFFKKMQNAESEEGRQLFFRNSRENEQLFILLRKTSLPRFVAFAAEPLSAEQLREVNFCELVHYFTTSLFYKILDSDAARDRCNGALFFGPVNNMCSRMACRNDGAQPNIFTRT